MPEVQIHDGCIKQQAVEQVEDATNTWEEPAGIFHTGLTFENHTSHASRGDILLYPGGFSETEFLFVYGSSIFASKMGQLAGNHFFTLLEGHEHLEAFGKLVLWEGAQDIEFSLADN